MLRAGFVTIIGGERPAVPIGNRQDPRLQGWRTREPRDSKDFLLVEGLAQQQGFDERVELLAMRVQEPLGLVVAFADDLEHLGVNGFSGLSLNGFAPA